MLRDGLTREHLIELGRAALRTRPAEPEVFGLAGALGDAIFACSLARMASDVDNGYWVSRAVDSFNAHGADASLHNGIAGLGFLLRRCSERGSMSELDTALVGHLEDLPPASMQAGAAGVAFYAALREERGTGAELRRAVVTYLEKTAVPRGDGIVWHTPVWYARARGMDVPTKPITEMGMVHGGAGALVALASLAAQGARGAVELLRPALRGAWAFMRPGLNGFGRVDFGSEGAPVSRESPFPGSWCVGDAGVLRALWIAARVLGDETSAKRAVDLLRRGAERDVTQGSPGVPGGLDLCCGAGAIAQVYWQMHRDTQDPVFRSASERLLDDCARGVERMTDISFGYGRMGVILALLADHMEGAAWDSVLGMSLIHPSAISLAGSQRS